MYVYAVAGVAVAGVVASLSAVRRAITRLTPRPTNIAVAVDRHMSAIMYGSAVPTTATSRIAVKGAFSKSATAADSMHSTRMDTGMVGKIRLRAIATIVQENKVGKVGPPRYPLLNDSANSRIFS